MSTLNCQSWKSRELVRQGVTVFTFDVLSKNRDSTSTEFGNADKEM